MSDVINDRLDKLTCRLCSEVSKKICIILDDDEQALACIEDIETFGDRDGAWAEAVSNIKERGLYEEFIAAYSQAAGRSEESIRFIFDNIDKVQLLRRHSVG